MLTPGSVSTDLGLAPASEEDKCRHFGLLIHLSIHAKIYLRQMIWNRYNLGSQVSRFITKVRYQGSSQTSGEETDKIPGLMLNVTIWIYYWC